LTENFLDDNNGNGGNNSTTTEARRRGDIRCVGNYIGHTMIVLYAIEIDDDTIMTASFDCSIKVWNKWSCECLRTIQTDYMITAQVSISTNKNLLFYVRSDESVEFRRLRDFEVVFRAFDFEGSINRICQLEDETFIVVVGGLIMKQWDISQTLSSLDYHDSSSSPRQTIDKSIKTFKGHTKEIYDVKQIKKDLLVSLSADEIKLWSVSSGQCLRSFYETMWNRLVKLSDGFFAGIHRVNATVLVFDENGHNVATYKLLEYATAMAKLTDGSLVYGNKSRIEMRRP